jgi:hypothetical protein
MQKIAIEGAYLFKTGSSILYIPGEISRLIVKKRKPIPGCRLSINMF